MVTMKWCTIVMLVFFGSTWADNAVDSIDYSIVNCPPLKSQEALDLEGIMGKWYVVEVLDHNVGPTKPISTARVVIDSCPIIKLKPYLRLLKLLWTEEAGDIEYTFRVPDPVKGPGFWISTAHQNGTLTQKTYAQFVGAVHVMKAVSNHMVLTFCAGNPDNQLYSVLMSRDHILQGRDIKGVHNLLVRRNLRIVSIRQTCAKGGAQTTSGNHLTLGVCWLVVLRLLMTLCQ